LLGVVRKEGERFWRRLSTSRNGANWRSATSRDSEPGDPRPVRGVGPAPAGYRARRCHLGDPFAPRSFSLHAIHKHGLRHEFRQEAIDEAHRVSQQPLGDREDLTHLPIVAIDPADARDHDDRHLGSADDDEDNKGGWKAIVAPSPM
jgi:ribonuclease R